MHRNIKIIVTEIKKKAELKSVDDKFILNFINKKIQNNKKLKERLEQDPVHILKAKPVKELIKQTRAHLRLAHGMFKPKEYKKVKDLLKKLTKTIKAKGIDAQESVDLHKDILKAHQSTKERIKLYSTLYDQIFQITGTPKTITDLGCGINPISWMYMGCKPTIHARELANDDIEILKQYYKLANLKGTVKQADLLTETKFPKTDITFLFKIVDVLENQHKGTIHQLLEHIKSKWVVISFATKTLGGKPMKTKRQWFNNLLKHNSYQYETLDKENEIFYIINNQ